MRPEKAVQRVYGVRGVANDIEVKLSSTRTDPEIARDARTNKEELLEKPKDVGCPFRRVSKPRERSQVTQLIVPALLATPSAPLGDLASSASVAANPTFSTRRQNALFFGENRPRRRLNKGTGSAKCLWCRPSLFPEGRLRVRSLAVMFLRCHARIKEGKEHRYWSVVENRRCGRGKGCPTASALPWRDQRYSAGKLVPNDRSFR
jgi:hypothetical protein